MSKAVQRISLALLAVLVIPTSVRAADTPTQKSNIVFILADDLGYMDIGANNPKTFYETRSIDRLAKEGMRFTAGYAACPVCSPTRASILTGCYQGHSKNGIYGDWVEEVDWSVGQVLDTLRELKLDRNTLVLFTSDNGGTPRAVNAPLRGFKGSTWEGGMREPTIAWWPGKIPAGTATDAITRRRTRSPSSISMAPYALNFAEARD